MGLGDPGDGGFDGGLGGRYSASANAAVSNGVNRSTQRPKFRDPQPAQLSDGDRAAMAKSALGKLSAALNGAQAPREIILDALNQMATPERDQARRSVRAVGEASSVFPPLTELSN